MITFSLLISSIVGGVLGHYTGKSIDKILNRRFERKIWLREFYDRRRVLIFNKEQENEN